MVIGMKIFGTDFHTDNHSADNQNDESVYSVTHFFLNITSIL